MYVRRSLSHSSPLWLTEASRHTTALLGTLRPLEHSLSFHLNDVLLADEPLDQWAPSWSLTALRFPDHLTLSTLLVARTSCSLNDIQHHIALPYFLRPLSHALFF